MIFHAVNVPGDFSWFPVTGIGVILVGKIIFCIHGIGSLALVMRLTVMNRTICFIGFLSHDFHDVDLAAFRPLSIKIFIGRHHPECRQITFSGRNLCTALKVSILKIMLALRIDTSRCIRFGSVRIYGFHRFDQQFSIYYLNIFIGVHICLPFLIDPALFVQFHVPVGTV